MSKIEVNAIEPQTGTTLTLGASGDTVTLAAGASQSGFGRQGTVNWSSTVQTTGFTAVSGNGYFCNTTSAAFTVTLPASPSAGDIVAIADYANTSATNNITVGRNSSKIDGQIVDAKIKVNGQVYTLVYVDSTQGWKTVYEAFNQISTSAFVTATGGTVITCGCYKTHIFTSSGCFVVSCAGNAQGSNSVEYLVVAGGGSGGGTAPNGNTVASAGGGAGGYRQNYPSPASAGLPVTATTYPITVGGGGAGGTAPTPSIGNNGSNSIFSTITSTGGGKGGVYGNPVGTVGSPGGSGGGGGFSQVPGPLAGGSGNTPPVSPPQGNNGGIGYAPRSGAGGGAGGVGAGNNPGPGTGNAGGVGSPMSPTFFGPTAPSYGTTGPAPGRYFAGGGGGGNECGPGGTGGSGGGGNGGGRPGGGVTSGTTNTGGGGGGGENNAVTFGSGGSGIVIIRYKYQ